VSLIPTASPLPPLNTFPRFRHHTNNPSLPDRQTKDLGSLSALGHFFKGSSATLGLTKVKDSCEKIQHFGARKDETGMNDIPEAKCLSLIGSTLEVVKVEYKEAERILRQFYKDPDAKS